MKEVSCQTGEVESTWKDQPKKLSAEEWEKASENGEISESRRRDVAPAKRTKEKRQGNAKRLGDLDGRGSSILPKGKSKNG